jgi:serine/threonine protein kinase/Flp pilus assembly protein TadD
MADSERIGPYRVLRRLGAGGMGEVVLAHDDRLDRLVAIKRLHDDAATPARRERFRREARIVARLDHPAIVRIHDVHHEAGHDYLIMEYVEGQTLRARCAAQPMTVSEVLDVAHQIALGMAAAHDRGVIHRDLKAENVLITPAGRARLTDFGIAKLEGDDTFTADGAVVGTFRAMSPEQALGRPIDHRSDLFSFGILLHEALTGESPFRAETAFLTVQRLVGDDPRPLDELVPSIPDGLARLVHQLLAKEPQLRPRDFHEVAEALGALAGQIPDAQDRDGSPYGGPPPAGEDTRSTEHSVVPTQPLPDTALTQPPPDTAAPTPPPPDAAPPDTPPADAAPPGAAATPDPGTASRGARDRPTVLESSDPGRRGAIRIRPYRRWLVAALGATALALLSLGLCRPPLSGHRDGSPVTRVAVLAPSVTGDAGHPFTAQLAAAVRNAVEASVQGRIGLELVSRGDLEVYIDGATQHASPAPGLQATHDAVGADEILATRLACERGGCQVTVERDAIAPASAPAESFRLELAGDSHTDPGAAVDAHLSQLYPDHPLPDAGGASALDPQDHATYLQRVESYWAREDAPSIATALEDIDRIHGRSPRSVDVLLFEVELLLHRYLEIRYLVPGDPEEGQRAMALLDEFDHRQPDRYDILSARFEVLLANPTRLDEAGAALDRLARRDPDSPTTHLQRARLHYERKDLEAARHELDAAARLGPQSWRTLYQRALVFKTLGDHGSARAALDQLLERSPGNYRGLSLLAGEELRAGQPACAAEIYAQLVAREPLHDECFELGAARMQIRSYREAAAGFRCALAARSDDPAARLGLAEALLLAGDPDTARDQLRDLRAWLDRKRLEAPSGTLTRRDAAVEARTLGYLGAQDPATAAAARARVDSLLADGRQFPTALPGALRTAALVHASLGDRELATRYAAKYLDGKNSPGDLAYPWFDDLLHDPVLDPRLAVPGTCAASPARGQDWLRTRSLTPGDIMDLWGDRPDNVFAVAGGYNTNCDGTILHYDGVSWQRMSSRTQACLIGIWGSGPRDIYAVGGWGTVLHYDGASWLPMSSGTESLLFGVWGSGPHDVYAVGVQGTILHYDGSRWQPMKSGTQQFLLRIWGSGPDDIYVTGGGALHYDGTSWQSIEAGSRLYHRAIWGTGRDDVYEVGSDGLIAHYDGHRWISMDSGTREWLHGIWGSGPNDVYAVGTHGTLLHYDGRGWSPMQSGEPSTLVSIWGDIHGRTRIFGGYGGEILHMTVPEQFIRR